MFVVLMLRSLSLVGVFTFVVMRVTVHHIAMFMFMVVLNYCRLFIEASATFAHMRLLVFVLELLPSANIFKLILLGVKTRFGHNLHISEKCAGLSSVFAGFFWADFLIH